MDFSIIEQKRKSMRYTKTAMCKLIGINTSTWYEWEKHPEQISLRHYRVLSEVLRLTKTEQDKLFN